MAEIIFFAHAQEEGTVRELQIGNAATGTNLYETLIAAGVRVDSDMFAFVEDAEHPVNRESRDKVPELSHGAVVHVTRCKRIAVTVHFKEKTVERPFAPGARVRRVKAWAVEEFKLAPKDAAEHVLQICKSTERPPTDTPLHKLTGSHGCAVCFDLVPEKRVEG